MQSKIDSMPVSSNHEDEQSAIAIFRNYLETEWKRQRTPKGLDSSLSAALTQRSTTAGIFLAYGGFSAWVAYFLATTPGEAHFSGRGAQIRTIDAFEKLSFDVRKMAAKRVAEESNIHSTTQAAITLLERHPKRQHLLASHIESNSDHETSENAPVAAQLPRAGTQQSRDFDDSTDNTEPSILVSDACPKAVAGFFPIELSMGIRKNIIPSNGTTCPKAAITMAFPVNPVWKQDCIMTIDIMQNKVVYFALVLFGVQVESEGSWRYLNHSDGSRIDPEPQITLRRCRVDAISKLFGEKIYRAVCTSEFRTIESEFGTVQVTDSVRMTITSNAEEGAMITLYSGLLEGYEIRNQLYN
ncbi:hypothetical protein F5Y16DRAFT_112422 [Xylariaceae sp. FL0255]|nr:hypothetical protein F5Y16DRAFT_112422 [Xylariaceae sp. FL0255]